MEYLEEDVNDQVTCSDLVRQIQAFVGKKQHTVWYG